jgi:hypothetical protein
MKRFAGLVLLVSLMFALPSAAEETATSGFTILRDAVIKDVIQEFSGFVAVRVETGTEGYWMFIDPTIGLDGAKMLLANVLAVRAGGHTVSVVYWGIDSGVKHDFQGKSWITSNRRILSIDSW